MIGLDWGTSSLRAWRIGADGAVTDTRSSKRGIMNVTDRAFETVLRETVGDWLAQGETNILLCGMVGSRQGWQEAKYLPCPAGLDDLASHLTSVAMDGAEVRIVPGLVGADADGVPEVMRGEEVQVLGAADRSDMRLCLPGTHSKWVRLAGGRIEQFSTFMTGEMFAALTEHTILAHSVRGNTVDPDAFNDGLRRARQAGGVLHHAFGVRTRVLRGEMTEAAAYGYLSGLLIGHELNAAFEGAEHPVAVVGADSLARLYADAITARGGSATIIGEAAAASGLARLGRAIGWV